MGKGAPTPRSPAHNSRYRDDIVYAGLSSGQRYRDDIVMQNTTLSCRYRDDNVTMVRELKS